MINLSAEEKSGAAESSRMFHNFRRFLSYPGLRRSMDLKNNSPLLSFLPCLLLPPAASTIRALKVVTVGRCCFPRPGFGSVQWVQPSVQLETLGAVLLSSRNRIQSPGAN